MSLLPPTPVKAGLFTAACEKVEATPRQILQLASPATAASINTAPPVSTTRDEVMSALKSKLNLVLKVASDYSILSLCSGYTVPPNTERALKQAALKCAERYFDDAEKQGMPILAATMAEFGISSRGKKTNTMISEMLTACVTRGVNVSREEFGIKIAFGKYHRLCLNATSRHTLSYIP